MPSTWATGSRRRKSTSTAARCITGRFPNGNRHPGGGVRAAPAVTPILTRRTLLALTALAFTSYVALLATGGFVATFGNVRVSARSPNTALILATLCAAAWLALAARTRRVQADLEDAGEWITRHANAIVLAVAIVAAGTSLRFATFGAAGSDASGYLSLAAMLARGELSYQEPLAAVAQWSGGPESLAPLGWIPRDGTTQVPTYAVGLPLLIAIPRAIAGEAGVALVISVSFAIGVWAIGALARAIAAPAAALLAAVWLATSPVALLESLQVMNDVPVTAAWLVCWLFVVHAEGRDLPARRSRGEVGHPSIAGAAAAIAILMRPNLAPAAAIPALYVWRHSGWRAAAIFAGPVAIAGAVVALLQWHWFGSPLRSGYGTAQEIYSLANIAPNAVLYSRWLIESHGPWLVIALLAVMTSRVRWLLAFAALVTLFYLAYAVFEMWAYVRFLLPALAMMMIGAAVFLARASTRFPGSVAAVVTVMLALAIGGDQVSRARELGVFRTAAQHARATTSARYLDQAMPPRAILISGEQSGVGRYFTGRPVLRWDLLASDALAPALDAVRREGYEPWILLDTWEEELFRKRFAATVPEIGALDWPPAVDAGIQLRTRAWRVRDRARFMRGERIVVDRLY